MEPLDGKDRTLKSGPVELQIDICKAVAQIDRLLDEIEKLKQQVKRMEFVARLNSETIYSMVEAQRKEDREREARERADRESFQNGTD